MMREHPPGATGIAKALALLVASLAALPACGSDSSSKTGIGNNASGAANGGGAESASGASNGGANAGGASNGSGGASNGGGGASNGSGGASNGGGGANTGGRLGNGGAPGGSAGGGTSSGGAAAGNGGASGSAGAKGSGGAGGSAGAPGTGGATSDAGTPKTIDHYVTFYGWPDNDPPGNGIAYPKLHKGAGGTGTYADPITFATDPAEWAPGTILYVPFLKRYVIMEDSCAECITDWKSKKYHIDLWLNSDGRLDSQVIDCEDAHTKSKTPVEIDPPPNRPVDATPLFDPSTGVCEPL